MPRFSKRLEIVVGRLALLFTQGIIHRDVKPANLLLDKKGTVKILDMGLVRITGAEAALGGAGHVWRPAH